jgi:hypothetical protein
MRRRSLVTAVAALAVGVTAAAIRRRVAARRLPARVAGWAGTEVAAPDARVLPFSPRTTAAPAPAQPVVDRPAAPVRCGDTGGRTKAGAPCAARITSGGRCHHHAVAA